MLEDLEESTQKEEKTIIIYNVEEKLFEGRQDKINHELKVCNEIYLSINVQEMEET